MRNRGNTADLQARAGRAGRSLAWLPLLAVVSLLLSAVWAGQMQPGFAHARHALSVLAASDVPHGHLAGFGIFVLPGLLLMWQAFAARGRLPATAAAGERLAWQMLLLAGLSFALQGVLPFTRGELPDAGGNRLHVLAGMLCWLCVWLSALCALCARSLAVGRRIGGLVILLLLPVLLLLAPMLVGGGAGQRGLVVLWLLWAVALPG